MGNNININDRWMQGDTSLHIREAGWNIYNALYHISGLSFCVTSINVIDLIVPTCPLKFQISRNLGNLYSVIYSIY